MPRREDYKLRNVEERDLNKVLEWRNSNHVRNNMFTDHIITMDEHISWFNKIVQNENVVYKIFNYMDRSVGLIYIVEIDKYSNKCYWGFYVGEINAPSGCGAIMEFLALEYIFEVLNIRKVCCEVFSYNESVIKLHKRFGFKEEGRLKNHVLKNAKYEDVISMAMFYDDWIQEKPKLEKILFGQCK